LRLFAGEENISNLRGPDKKPQRSALLRGKGGTEAVMPEEAGIGYCLAGVY